MADEIVRRLQRFQRRYFPRLRSQYRSLVEDGQHPSVLFIGCSDSRVVPYLMLDSGPGDLFIVRNVGNFVPPFDASLGYHGTAAAVEFAVLNLNISEIIVCGHSHCGAVRTAYEGVPEEARALRFWLELAQEALLPVRPSPEALWRSEQRSVVLQLERLMDYPMVRRAVEAGNLSLHGWHYVIEDGEVHVFDAAAGGFVPASRANSSGTGPYAPYIEHDGQPIVD